MTSLSVVSGWLAYALIAIAASVPFYARWREGKRVGPASKPMALHVQLGLAVAAVTFFHTLAILPALGSPEAVAGGMLAIAPAVVAFFLLFAHVGVGLQLRNPKLRERAKKRRLHVVLASLIAITATAHVALLLRAG